MLIKQVSVFLENKRGRIEKVTKCLADEGINIRALSIADTTDFGILRMILSDPDQAGSVLRENGFTVTITDVIALTVDDQPGGLSRALSIIGKNNIGIEYIYAFIGKSQGKAQVVLRTETPETSAKLLQEAGYEVLDSIHAYAM
ncbi:MAG TPA: acetolactate synthase [Clostridiales bacterium]|nr:acetolactate synthase [Clostridiales bacterium]